MFGSGLRTEFKKSMENRFPAKQRELPKIKQGACEAIDDVFKAGDPTPQKAKEAVTNAIEVAAASPSGSKVSEDAVTFVYRILDRQISKSTGLLSYNGLLLATLNLTAGHLSSPTYAITFGRIAAIVAATSVLPLLWVHWGKNSDYESADADLEGVLKTLQWRTWCVTIAICCSGFATVFTALALFFPGAGPALE